MPPKLKNIAKSPKGKRTAYIAPNPKKPIIWGHVAPGISMLRYRPSIKETGSSVMARRFKNPSACIVAPVYAAVEEFHDWSPALVDNIFEIANEVHRITLQQLKLRANSSYPIQCVCPTFLLNYNKVTIIVRPCATSNPLQGGVTCSPEDVQIRAVDTLLGEYHGVILQCSGKTFAFWKDKGKFYAFIPEGDEFHIPVLLKSADLRGILVHCLKLERGICNLYSLKILSKEKITMTLDDVNKEFEIPEPRESIEPTLDRPAEVEAEASPAPAQASSKTKGDKNKTDDTDAPDQAPSEDATLSFSSDYKELPDNRGILVGKEYCKNRDRILHTIVAAAVFLHHFPANLWTSTIIRDIMKLSKTMFYQSENDDLLENEDWMDRLKFPIKFMKKHFSAIFEKVVFGKVHSVDPEVLTVEQGLVRFFQGNDTGLLLGPQMVLVWQQKHNYFMFDPKERDGMGRKWTRMFSAELGSTGPAGSACITWYRSPKKLAQVYTDNVALKHRKDPYRIVKIRVLETTSKAHDEGEWIGMSTNRWILVGTKTLCDYSYAEDTLRVGKSICIGVSALMHAIERPEEDWDNAIIDEVLRAGVELCKQSVAAREPGKPFTLLSIKKVVNIDGRRMRVQIIDCLTRGPMLAESKGKDSVPLETGLNDFFEHTRYGVFTVKDIALAIWRGQDNHYYLFFPYEKLFGMPPQCLCTNDSDLPPMGIANAMRFATFDDMFSFLTTCLNTKENDEYCLNPVDISLSNAIDRPPLLGYEEFGVSGAIIRPFKGLHEGHDVFGARGGKQTLANLLTALGFNRINGSTNWTKEDLADILNIGDKIFCKIFMGLPECQARDYRLQWEDVVPVIGINKFSFTRQPIVGVLEIPPELTSEEAEQELVGQEDYDNEEGIEAQDDELYVPPQEGMPAKPVFGNDLQGILKAWDKKNSDHHEAVIESDFFKIAIWKRDDLYFVFDPKASGENGQLTERRIEMGKDYAAGDSIPFAEPPADEAEHNTNTLSQPPLFIEKRSYTQFDNEGTAYTAWFSDFNEFYNHISMKTPDEYRYGKFTLQDLLLSGTPLGTDDLEHHLKPGYRHIAPNHSILRGSMTQNNPSLTNRNKQEFSNCLVAIAFARITPSNKMTTTLMDVVLKYGDRLYTKSLNALKKTDYARFCEIEKLSLDDISTVFSIYKIKFNWKLTATIRGNLFMNELRKATGKLATIESGAAMLLSHKGYLMAFWRSDGGFYMYDPFETNPSGWLVENGLPSLSKFAKLDSLLSYLVTKFACVRGANTFLMYSITINSAPVAELHLTSVENEDDDEKMHLASSIPKDQEMFQSIEAGMRILKSPLTSAAIPQHCLALAALVHSRLQFVELWNYNISQRISFLSKCLLQKSRCEDEASQVPVTFDDIRTSFVIDNDILCHIVFTKNMQGPIHSLKRTEIVGVNLKNALTMFFKNCQQVIVSMPGFGSAFALWKESGLFYLFGVDDQPEIFVIASPVLSNLYDTLLKGTNRDGDVNNWYELRSVNVTTVPIKEGICKPLAIVENVAEGPCATKGGDYYSADSAESHYYDHVSAKPEGLPIKPQPNEFVPITKGVEVLYSKDILRSHKFYGTNDFFSSIQAACIESSALSRVKSPTLWTKRTLEKILTAGVNLYINTVAVKGTSNLKMTDFRGKLFISNYKLEVCPLPPKVQGASKDELVLSLTWILRNYQTAYLHTDKFCFALILEKNYYFLYYPGSGQVLCDDLQNDRSCLIRFCSISDLLDRILSNGEISLCENIFIGPINVCVKY